MHSLLVFLPSFVYFAKSIEFLIFYNLLLFTFFFFLSKNNFLRKDLFYNKKNLFFFTIIIYISFQILPISEEIIEIISPKSYYYYKNIDNGHNLFFISLNPLLTIKFLTIYLNLFLLFLITTGLIYSKKDLRQILFYSFILSFLHVVYGLIALSNGSILYFYNKLDLDILSGFFINRNHYSFFLVLIFVLCIYYINLYNKYFATKFESKWLGFILSDIFLIRVFLILVSISIILTKSRTGNITFIFLILLILFFEFNKFKKLTFLSKILITILFLDVLVIGSIIGFDQVISRLYMIPLDGGINRFDIFHFGLSSFLEFPFFGYGLGNFETIFRLEFGSYSFLYDHVHNDFIELMGELGVIGFIILIAFFIKLYLIYIKSLLPFKEIILLSFFSALFHANFDFILHMPQILSLMVFLISLLNCKIKT